MGAGKSKQKNPARARAAKTKTPRRRRGEGERGRAAETVTAATTTTTTVATDEATAATVAAPTVVITSAAVPAGEVSPSGSGAALVARQDEPGKGAAPPARAAAPSLASPPPAPNAKRPPTKLQIVAPPRAAPSRLAVAGADGGSLTPASAEGGRHGPRGHAAASSSRAAPSGARTGRVAGDSAAAAGPKQQLLRGRATHGDEDGRAAEAETPSTPSVGTPASAADPLSVAAAAAAMARETAGGTGSTLSATAAAGGTEAASPASSCSPSPKSVRVIDKYALGPVIGRGAFNVVRLATDMETGARAAMKIFSKRKLGVEDDTWAKMRKEVGLMHLSSHAGVVGLVDVMETDKRICLVLEYMAGGDLFNLVEQAGRLPPSQAMDFFWQLLQAVKHCHALNICHRDIKPGNILLSADRRTVKLADFGLARLQKRSLCQTACGSPHYMAPEAFLREPYDGRAADIWSMGVVLYVMVEAALPFWAANNVAMYQDIAAGRYEAPVAPPAVTDVIRRCLTPDAGLRATIEELEGMRAVREAGRLHRRRAEAGVVPVAVEGAAARGTAAARAAAVLDA